MNHHGHGFATIARSSAHVVTRIRFRGVIAALATVLLMVACLGNRTFVLSPRSLTLDTTWIELKSERPIPSDGDYRNLALFLSTHYRVREDLRVEDSSKSSGMLVSAELILLDGQRVQLGCCGTTVLGDHRELILSPRASIPGGSPISAVRLRASGIIQVDSVLWQSYGWTSSASGR